jgi:hypothetical protein
MIIKKKPVFKLDGPTTWQLYLNVGDLDGCTINGFTDFIEGKVKEGIPSNMEILDIGASSFYVEQYYEDVTFYIYVPVKFKDEFIEEKRKEFEKKLVEYEQWYANNQEEIQKELERREKKKIHDDNIRELERQIEELKRMKKVMQDGI